MPPSPAILQDLRDAYQSGNLVVFAGAGISSAAGLPGWKNILELHGTRIERSTWVFTREQYDQATFGWPLHRGTFEALFRAFPILFVGYGLADDDFDLALGAARALAGAQPPTHFALVQGPIAPFRRRKLEDAGLRLLEYGSHGDVPGLLRSIP